jgi:Undecaprenyl-phosphate galactose phosphotransferase WbaP
MREATVTTAPVQAGTPPPSARRWLAFAAGVGFAFVPAFGPFLALLVMVTGRIEVRRDDRYWWAAAALLGLPWLVTGEAGAGAMAVAQGLAAWLIYRSAAAVREATGNLGVWREASVGVLLGLTGVLLRGVAQMEELDFAVQRSFAQAIAWSAHPNLFAHTILAASLLVAILVPGPKQRLGALAIGAVGILAAGAREAAVAWVVVAIVLVLRDRVAGRVRLAALSLIGAVLVVAAGVGPALGLGRTGFLVDLVGLDARLNLLRGTEVARGDWWHRLGVSFVATDGPVAGQDLTVYTLTKTARDPWSRLQQVVSLEPGDYTLSAWLRPDEGAAVGLDGWGRSGDREFALSLTLRPSGWAATAAGPIAVLGHEELARDGDWRRVALTLRYEGEPTAWYVGIVPDRTTATGGRAAFAALQLERGEGASPYAAAPADRGLDLAAGRLPLWRDAIEASSARPLLGWGPGGLREVMARTEDGEARNRPIPAHAHSAYLDALVGRGLVGLAGLLLLVAMLASHAVRGRDVAALAVLGALLAVNAFDTTLLYGGVLYPLAAVLGWRSVAARDVGHADSPGSGLAARLALATGDYLAALAALFAANAVTGAIGGAGAAFVPAAPYVALAWPMMAWREGNYPGYGRQPAEELRSTVVAAAQASLLVAFASLVFRESLPIPPAVMLVATLGSLVALPLGRAVTKRALLGLSLWGRQLVVLGHGAEATALVEHLRSRPLLGLHPVASFGPAPDGAAATIDRAWRFLEEHRVRHVILAAAEFDVETVEDVLERAHRSLRYLQVLPDLRGLPATAVAAVPLGQSLTLQLRNELASVTNRTIKRTVDVAAAAVLLVLFAPLLAALWTLVRLDSRGPGLYRSPRLGRDGIVFDCLKFRTMRADAERGLHGLLASDPSLGDEYRSFHKLRSDPRVTRLGRYLRAASLDELPQLLNVLAGSMSIIGPRPYMVQEEQAMGRSRKVILSARPGITGYWQVYGRNAVPFEARLEMESYYVRNWSLWWDLVILLETPRALLARRGK